MTREERAKLIRDRVRALVGRKDFSPKRQPRDLRTLPISKANKSRMYPLGCSLADERPKWVERPDNIPASATPKVKRTAQPSPLILIAAKWRPQRTAPR